MWPSHLFIIEKNMYTEYVDRNIEIIFSVPVQSDWLNSALSPVVYGDIALSINT